MELKNVEIKAWCDHPDRVENKLLELGARFHGLDKQTDTYFNCSGGRLKLREGNIENALIYYERDNQEKPKASNVELFPLDPDKDILTLLTKALGIFKVVKKDRKIFYLRNIKIHLDHLIGLGYFLEIEALSNHPEIDDDSLRKQCEELMDKLEVDRSRLISHSYSDMV